jgi:pyruvate ferredoxin oxidoreductase alpha subunit
MSMRDAGWIQLFAKDNQEAADLHVQAFRLAETLSCPVMVCVDGFILTHAFEQVDIPSQEEVDAFLPPYDPVQTLDPAEPVTIGAMVGPEAFAEVRWLAHHKQLRALELIPQIASDFASAFGRPSGGLLRPYRVDGAETIVVAMGSVNGTIEDVVDEMRAQGVAIGSVDVCTFRPFPTEAVRAALQGAKRVVVLEKNLALGTGGVLASHVRMALRGDATVVHTLIAGLGGRAITRASLTRAFAAAHASSLEELHMLDLDDKLIERELARSAEKRRSGPTASNLVRDVGPSMQRIS